MSPDKFIEVAIQTGAQQGIEALDANQRLVFLIAEAEVLCAMEGIDTFLDNYGPKWIPECAAAFEAVGAQEIADCFRLLLILETLDETLLNHLNTLITGTDNGYDYEALRRTIAARIG